MHKEPDSYKKANSPKLSEFAFLFENEVKKHLSYGFVISKKHIKNTPFIS
ncbi:hypothetical protein PSKAS_11030 [Peribacillus sp. N1]